MAENLTIKDLWLMKIDWRKSDRNAYLFTTSVAGQEVQLRLNDFPEEPICTIIWSDGNEQNLEDLGKEWTLPKHRGEIE